jgi:hypothetical protein
VTATPSDPPKDECYRCDYNLRGIANEQACPECGLLAERSRRVSDELHQTRPRWLRSLSWGISLILLAFLMPLAWSLTLADLVEGYVIVPLYSRSPAAVGSRRIVVHGLVVPLSSPLSWWATQVRPMLGIDLGALFLLLGMIFLTRREGYPPADRADRRLRLILRSLAIAPLAGAILMHLALQYDLFGYHYAESRIWLPMDVAASCLLLWSSFPLFLFLHLRGLARRARSAHLAEHCMIVGIGASVTVLFAGVAVGFANHYGRDVHQLDLFVAANWMVCVMTIAAMQFTIWTIYLLVRFAVAFWIAARQLRRTWNRDDRSLTPPDSGGVP